MKLPKNIAALADVVDTMARSDAENHKGLLGSLDPKTMQGACGAVSHVFVQAVNRFGLGRAELCATDIGRHAWAVVTKDGESFVVDMTYTQFDERARRVHVVRVGTPRYRKYLARVTGRNTIVTAEAACFTGTTAKAVARHFAVPLDGYRGILPRISGLFS